MVKISGQMGVPVILVDGQMVIGFNQQKLEELLAK
jgi:glutaredoxin